MANEKWGLIVIKRVNLSNNNAINIVMNNFHLWRRTQDLIAELRDHSNTFNTFWWTFANELKSVNTIKISIIPHRNHPIGVFSNIPIPWSRASQISLNYLLSRQSNGSNSSVAVPRGSQLTKQIHYPFLSPLLTEFGVSWSARYFPRLRNICVHDTVAPKLWMCLNNSVDEILAYNLLARINDTSAVLTYFEMPPGPLC